MRHDDSRTDDRDRLKQIQKDLDYFKGVLRSSGAGAQPPTVYASKYVQDVEFIMALADRLAIAQAEEPAPKTSTPKPSPR